MICLLSASSYFTYNGSLRSHKTPLKGLRWMALPALVEELATEFLAFELAPPDPESWPRGLTLFDGGGGGEGSSSDMVSSVSGFSLRWRFLAAPGPLVKLANPPGGGAGASGTPWWRWSVGDGVIPDGLSWTMLLALEGNWPSRLSWSTISLLPAEN